MNSKAVVPTDSPPAGCGQVDASLLRRVQDVHVLRGRTGRREGRERREVVDSVGLRRSLRQAKVAPTLDTRDSHLWHLHGEYIAVCPLEVDLTEHRALALEVARLRHLVTALVVRSRRTHTQRAPAALSAQRSGERPRRSGRSEGCHRSGSTTVAGSLRLDARANTQKTLGWRVC